MSDAPPNAADEHGSLSTTFLKGVQRMEPAAWGRLVIAFGPIVYRWCRASGIRQDDAPDVTQEVFATVARGIANFERRKAEGSFRSWLATITRSRIRDFHRRTSRHEPALGGTDAMLRIQQIADDLDSTISGENIESPLARRTLDIVRAEFEPTTWQAFWMTTIDGLKASLVADRLGISLASVYQARSRVLRKLRQRLSELPR